MTHYLTDWKRISTRINSLTHSCASFYGAFPKNDNGASKMYHRNCVGIYNSIREFHCNYKALIPETVLCVLEDFLNDEKHSQWFRDTESRSKSLQDYLKPMLACLSCLESEITYCLTETQTQILKSVEVAFAHLQRSLVVDAKLELENKWCQTKKNGEKFDETDYEKLGAAHLLLHKIWAFKAHSTGERTDLILLEPNSSVYINENDTLYKSVDGLVLTEWKVATQGDYVKKIKDAKEQALLYKFGSLYPLELKNHCFLVMVSEKRLKIDYEKIKEDISPANGINFHLINIAYKPDCPSDDAKKRSK